LLLTPTLVSVLIVFLLFFFQAEDGIRDRNVTGVQTCALPISGGSQTTSCSSTSRPSFSLIFPSHSTASWIMPPKATRARFIQHPLLLLCFPSQLYFPKHQSR